MNSFLHRTAVIAVFLVASSFFPCVAGEVWCLPEYYRIDAVSGTVAELGHKAVDPAFKTRNAIFDRENGVVRLQAMRGETLSFQIVIEGESAGVTLEADGFPAAPEFFYEGYLPWLDEAGGQVRYTPEVAIPLDWLNGGFDVLGVPHPLPAAPGKRLQAIWVDLPVPRDQPVGAFRGHIRVSDNKGELTSVEVIVDVLNLTLPEQPVWLQGMITYSLFGQKYPQREADAWRCMQAHRLSIHEVPYSSQRGYAMSDAIPKTTLSGAFDRFDEFRKKAIHLSAADRAIYPYEPEIERLRDPARHTVTGEDLQQRLNETMVLHDLILKECRKLYGEGGAGVTDWTEFDRRYGPLFDGTAFKDGIPVASFELPFNFNWPAPLDRFEIEEPAQSAMFEAIWVKVARDLLDHFTEKGWTRTRFFVYFNPKDSGNNLSMWKGDEPTEEKDFLSHRYFHTLFQKAFANPGRIKIDHKIEVGHWECDAGFCRKRDQVEKTWDESNARNLLRDFRVWVCNSRHYQSAREVAWKQMEEQGDEFFTYGGLATIDQTSMAVYGMAFLGFENRTFGNFLYVPQMGDLTGWTTQPGSHLDRMVAQYDAGAFGKDTQFLMSLRLKSLRSVEQHLAAFRFAAEKDPAFGEYLKRETVKHIIASGGPDQGSTIEIVHNNPETLFAARSQALAIATGGPYETSALRLPTRIKGVGIRTDSFHYCIACGEASGRDRCEWCGVLQSSTTPASPTRTLVLRQGLNGYDGCRDHFVSATTPGQNRIDRLILESNGKGASLNAILLSFDIPKDAVPDAKRIVSASLVLSCNRQSNGGGGGSIFLLKSDWNGTLNFPAVESLAGEEIGKYTLGDYRRGCVEISPPEPVSFDVSDAVRRWVSGQSPNHGLLLKADPNQACDCRFFPSEAENIDFRPELRIEIAEGENPTTGKE